MTTLPLHVEGGHVFVDLHGELWLLDTGAPASFGRARNISVAGERFRLGGSYLGLTVDVLSEFVGVACTGLLGADVLGCFDHVFDAANGTLTVTTGELQHDGTVLNLDQFMGIPRVTARVGRSECRVFFDTGAQMSYLEDELLAEYPPAGRVMDFYPGVGRFETETHWVPVSLGGIVFTLRCGRLPDLLGGALLAAGTQGIVGNAILAKRTVGYFPRRGVMVL